MRISNSFSEGEVQVLDFILSTLLRGGTPTMAARHKDFASLCRKVMSMKTRMIEHQHKEGGSSDISPDRSSVGEIAAPVAELVEEPLKDVG